MNAMEDTLWGYTGLHMSHLEALRDPGSAYIARHPGLARLREGAGSHPKRGGRPCRASGLTPP